MLLKPKKVTEIKKTIILVLMIFHYNENLKTQNQNQSKTTFNH